MIPSSCEFNMAKTKWNTPTEVQKTMSGMDYCSYEVLKFTEILGEVVIASDW